MAGPIIIAVVVTGLMVCMMTWLAARAANNRDALRAAGLSKNSAALYRRAARIIRRLDGITDFDGDVAADILSPETKAQVAAWVADYRKELSK